MAFTEDMSAFFNTDEHADNATLAGVAVVGIVQAGYDNPALLDMGGGAGASPSFVLPSASVPVKPEGLLLVIASGPAAGTYRVTNARHDGAGVCTLELIDR